MDRDYTFRMLATGAEPESQLDMVCLDDEAALLLAERFAMRQPVEVWTCGLLLGRAEPGARAVTASPSTRGLPGGAPEMGANGEPAADPSRPRRFWAGAWSRGG